MLTLTENRWRGTWKAHSCWPVDNSRAWYELCASVSSSAGSLQYFWPGPFGCSLNGLECSTYCFPFHYSSPWAAHLTRRGSPAWGTQAYKHPTPQQQLIQMNFFSLLIYSSTIAVVIVVHASVPLSIWSNKVLSENGVLWSHTCFVHHLWDLTSFC